jgi:hypothetical protein
VKGHVDISFKYCRYIYKSKGLDQGLKEAIVGVYGCLLDILISYSDEDIAILNINFGDEFCFG